MILSLALGVMIPFILELILKFRQDYLNKIQSDLETATLKAQAEILKNEIFLRDWEDISKSANLLTYKNKDQHIEIRNVFDYDVATFYYQGSVWVTSNDKLIEVLKKNNKNVVHSNDTQGMICL